MTINDLTTYTDASSFFLFAGIAVAALGTLTAILLAASTLRRPRLVSNIAMSVTVGLVIGSMAGGIVTAQQAVKAAPEAWAANAKVLQDWAEPAYGITIDDYEASRVMAIWADGNAKQRISLLEPSFEAIGPDGEMTLKLEEQRDGSFRLIQTARVLEPAGAE